MGLILKRNLNDGEIEDFLALLNCLQNSPVNSLRRDKMKWGAAAEMGLVILCSEIQEEFD